MRADVGDLRLDTREQVTALNALYDDHWCYHNFFQPVLRLAEKVIVDDQRVRRVWDTAQTPYRRLLASEILAPEVAQALATRYAATNPRQLRRQIEQQRMALWQNALPPAIAAD